MTEDEPVAAGTVEHHTTSKAPSAWKIELAMSAWLSARARLLHDDGELARDEAALTALLGEEGGTVDEIITRLAKAALHAKAMAAAAASMMDDLRIRQDRYSRRHEQFRATLFSIMEALGEKKKELPFATLAIRAGTQSAIITDEAALTDEYVRVTRAPDKVAILADLKVGVVIAGAELSNGIPSLQMRNK